MSDQIPPVRCDAPQRAADSPLFSRQLSGPNALPCLSGQHWPAREERAIGGETIGDFTILTAVAEHG
jgi:hypothetical protein